MTPLQIAREALETLLANNRQGATGQRSRDGWNLARQALAAIDAAERAVVAEQKDAEK